MYIFVNGELMQGLSMHHLMDTAHFVKRDRTAPVYRLYSIENRYPAMIMAVAPENGFAISGEIYDVPDTLWPTLFENERRLGLYRGHIWLQDGTGMGGILSVRELCHTFPDISSYGGWREYLASLPPSQR